MAYVLLASNVVLLVLGQALWKQAITRAGGAGLALVWQPGLWGGLLAYGIATLIWLAVLGRLKLSVAYPVQASAYALGVVVARWIFSEPVPPLRWVGVGVILLGALLVAYQR